MTSTGSPAAEVRREQAAELGRRYGAGASVKELERDFGLSHGTVLNRLRQAGAVMRTPAQTRRLQAAHHEDARPAQAVRLRTQYEQENASVEALAMKEGLSARTVRRRLAEAGTTLRTGQQTRRLAAGATAVEARQRLAADVRRRYEAGEGVPALAADCGTSQSTVYRLLRLAHTVMRPQHRHGPHKRTARPP